MSNARTFTHTTGAELHYTAHGTTGRPVLSLHGAYSTHEEIAAIVEPLFASGGAHRRLYPDLPGMGDTPADGTLQSANDVVDLLDAFVSNEIGTEPFLLIGHSYGAHLARGLAARRPNQVIGLTLICPVVAPNSAEDHVVVRAAGKPHELIDPDHLDDFLGYFVVHTPKTAGRFNEAVAPSLGRFDAAAVESLMGDSELHPNPDDVAYSAPSLVLTGRQDSLVGYRDQLTLIDTYPDATHIAIADAGHALPHEHPDLTTHLLSDWLSRTATHDLA